MEKFPRSGGSAVTPAAGLGSPTGIAVDNTDVYQVGVTGGSVMKAAK